MSRALRISYPGAFYHITSRGNEKKDIFLHKNDRLLFLRILAFVVKKNNWICHAYVLMGNHYHLLIETPDANLSRGMRQLNGVYTQKFNESHQRVGHLFQGRFKAFLIEDTFYLLNVARYIVLNPVRAGIIKDIREYWWSSYLATVGFAPRKSFLTIDTILSRFSSKKHLSQQRYCAFVEEGITEPSPFLDVKNNILGTERFIYEISDATQTSKTIIEIPKIQRIIGRPLLKDLFAGISSKYDRNCAMHFAVFSCGYSSAVVARFFSLHYSTVSRIVNDARFKT